MQRLAARHLENRRFDGVLLERFDERCVLLRTRDRGVEEAGRAEGHRLDGVGPDSHLAELVPDRPERRDRPPELTPIRAVPCRLADCAPRTAHRRRGELEAAVVQHAEGDDVAPPDLAEHVLGRHAGVPEEHRRGRRAEQAHLVLLGAARHALERPLDDERGELLAVDLREDDVDIGETAVRDPHLLAVQQEAAVRLACRARLRAEGVRPRARFAQAVRADGFAAHEPRQVAPLLGLGPEGADRHDDEPGLRSEGRAERPGVAQASGDQGRAHLVEPDAAVGFRHVRAEQTELAAAAEQTPREVPVLRLELVVLVDHLPGDELVRRPVDEPLLVGQALRREDRLGGRRCKEPSAASRRRGGRGCRSRHDGLVVDRLFRQIRSKIPAAPMPPPTHIVTIP